MGTQSPLPASTTSDYVIVGAGAAGSAIVRRLIDANHSVTLLEAGPADDHEALHDPSGNVFELFGGPYTWPYEYVPQRYAGGRVIEQGAGRTLGGGSAVNGFVYVRGVPQDYDNWAMNGARGWQWSEVKPRFDRLERYISESGTEGRGADGPVGITKATKLNPAATAWVEAAIQAGHPLRDDYNVGDSAGVARVQHIIADGRRSSAWSAYGRPIEDSPLLTVMTETTATSLVFDGDRVIGVDCLVGADRTPTRVLADSEVIVSSGGIGTPKLLLLSGIGAADELRRLDIGVNADLPGVGQNFMDHPLLPVVYETFESTGAHGTSMADANAFLRTRPDVLAPDVQAEFGNLVWPTAAAGRPLPENGFAIVTMLMHPLSRGSVKLRSKDPFELPLADPNFYAEPADLEVLLDGLEQVRDIARQPALQSLVKGEARPGPDLTSRQQLREYARATTTSTYHPSGTAKMGIDSQSVVDPELRVHGVEGLRVADNSIMPTLVTGNTVGPAMMIGERAADLILGRSIA